MIKIFILVIMLCTQMYAVGKPERGILIWFYSFETKSNKEYGEIKYFKQTAGANTAAQTIHHILPLSPQSRIIQEKDNNWYLSLTQKDMLVKKSRPIFLGQIIDMSLLKTYTKKLPLKNNIPVASLHFDKSFNQYLCDRKDLDIHNLLIQKKRDELLNGAPKLYDYLVAVDRFVLQHLKYQKPKRPNTAVDLLLSNKGWCGEHSKLKQALLRSAGIPTRGVYTSKINKKGPSALSKDTSGIHSWLQVYIQDLGWITMPSTRKLNDNYNFVRYRGGYYIRALHLYQYEKNIQQMKYSKSLKRNGGLRGNGMFFQIDKHYFSTIQTIVNDALNYSHMPSKDIFAKIENLPKKIQPLLYWFLISSDNRSINTLATTKFIQSIKLQPEQDFKRYYKISSTLVKKRIDNYLQIK